MTEPTYACSLDDEQLAARREDWKALDRRALVRTEASDGGRLLVYRGGEETAQALRVLIDAEGECCSFLDFRIDRLGDEVRVAVSFPPEATRTAIEIGLAPPS
jgi:hypothetical protein